MALLNTASGCWALPSSRSYMAPMAGVTDPAYRIMCRRRGVNLAFPVRW